MTRFDFDGNLSGFDNVTNAGRHELPAAVYGEVIAETRDAYYLFYGVYHLADYDTPLREFFIPSSRHDNDFEGAMLIVSRHSEEVLAAETWFHSRFLQFAYAPKMDGDQTIDGRLYLEDGAHPILFVQSLGHGVRAWQQLDEPLLSSGRYQIYRISGQTTPPPERQDSIFRDYILLPLGDFISGATGPFDENSILSDPQDFGLGAALGKYISGRFRGDSAWARPKPPWSWTDKFDELRPGAWFFHPAHVFNLHFGFRYSENYLYNVALQEILGCPETELSSWVSQRVPSFFNIPPGPLAYWMKKVRIQLYRVSEYLFYLLG